VEVERSLRIATVRNSWRFQVGGCRRETGDGRNEVGGWRLQVGGCFISAFPHYHISAFPQSGI